MPPSMRASMPPEVPMYVLPEPSRMRHTACSDRHRQTDTDRRFRTRVGGEHKLDGLGHRHCMYTHTGCVPTDCVLPILLSLSLSLSLSYLSSLSVFLSGYTYRRTDAVGRAACELAHTHAYTNREREGDAQTLHPTRGRTAYGALCSFYFYFYFYYFYYSHLFVYILLLVRR
jgi:hypothetical protein